jgi:hypothetical protein
VGKNHIYNIGNSDISNTVFGGIWKYGFKPYLTIAGHQSLMPKNCEFAVLI